MAYTDGYDLINSREGELNGENATLFTIEHYFLTESSFDFHVLVSAIHKMRIKTGIYHQHPCASLVGDERYMSHDQLTALFAFSYYNNLYLHKELWREIKRQWFRYNTVEVPQTIKEKIFNTRFIHPRDIIFFGYCAGSWFWKLLLPVLWIIMLISSIKTYKIRGNNKFIATDGKLLNFVRISSTKKKSLLWRFQWWLNTLIIREKLGSWNKVFRIYFPFDNHPNVIASKDI